MGDEASEFRGLDEDDHDAAADLLVLPSLYEGFGMVVTEAVARGVPVVATTGGAIPRTLPEGAGVLVPPGDARALGETLEQIVTSPERLEALRRKARRARGSLIRWEESATRFERALERVPA